MATYEAAPITSEWFRYGKHIKQEDSPGRPLPPTSTGSGAGNDTSQLMTLMTTMLVQQLMSQHNAAAQASSPILPPPRPITPQPVADTVQRPPLSPTPPDNFDMAKWEVDCALLDDEKEKFSYLGYDGQPLSTIDTKDVIHAGPYGFKLLRWQRLVRADEKHRLASYF
jgi:hypothetical protein